MAARMKPGSRGPRPPAKRLPKRNSRPAGHARAAVRSKPKAKAPRVGSRSKRKAPKNMKPKRVTARAQKPAKRTNPKVRPKAKAKKAKERPKEKARAKSKTPPVPAPPPKVVAEAPLDKRLGTEWLLDLMERRGMAPERP